MRIRKNTKLSSMLLATTGFAGERPETYVCHLNQSPWDVIPVSSSGDDNELTNLLDSYWFLPPPRLPPSSSSSLPRIHNKFKGEVSFNGINMSLADSNGVTERVNSVERSPEVKEPVKSKPSPVKTSDDNKVTPVTIPAPPKRGRPRGTGKKAPATVAAANNNPYEFYYYSGFGPRWGKKRGGSGDNNGSEKIVLSNENDDNNHMRKKKSGGGGGSDETAAFGDGSNSSSFDGFEFMDEDFDNNVVNQEEEEDSDDREMKKKKKMIVRKRKPVKERSLKSLM